MKIVRRNGKDIGSEAYEGTIFFVVPTSANSLETIYFVSVSVDSAIDFILANEWAHKIRPVPGV